MKAILSSTVLWAAALLMVPATQAQDSSDQGTSDRPNVIFIMADDLGYADLGSYGQEQVHTPNLDRLAREGTRFTDFYAGHTVCAPSRYALFTGRHTGRTPIRGNVMMEPRGDYPLPADDTTLAEVFENAGYRTGVFGKWALGLKGTRGAPHRQGFDAFFGYEDQSEAHFYYTDRLQAIEHGVTVNVDVDTTQYTHRLLEEATLTFLEEQQRREDPFFLYLPYTIPHTNLVLPRDALATYLNEEGESIFEEPDRPWEDGQPPNAAYAAMVTRLDRTVGRIVETLEAQGLAEDTILLFTSDNGPHGAGGHSVEAFDSNGSLRGNKRDLYEGGIRVPMIAWGPGHVPAGRTSDTPWAAWDLLPTFADLVGAEAPSGLDGRSAARLLTGDRAGTFDRGGSPLYWEFVHQGALQQAVRNGRWKLVQFTDLESGDRTTELYDLDEDVGETNDLSDNHPGIVDEMRSLMDQARTTPEMESFRVLEKVSTDD